MPDYFSIKAINNTALGYINLKKGGSLQKFKQFMDGTLEDDEKKYLRTGSLVHLHSLEPEKFKVAEVEKPSDAIVAIVDAVHSLTKIQESEVFGEISDNLSDYSLLIETAVIEAGYQSNWKMETRVSKVIEQGSAYFKYLVERETSDQILMTSKEFATVMACSASLKTDPLIQPVMFPEDVSEDVEIFREKEIFFEYKGLQCKAKLDMLIVNHKKETFQIVDLKTTGKSVMNFNESFNMYDYYRQLAFYEIAVHSLYPTYQQIYDPFIVAVETFGYYRARLFTVKSSAMNYGLSEVDRLMDLIIHCQTTGNWVYEPEYLEAQYELSLEV